MNSNTLYGLPRGTETENVIKHTTEKRNDHGQAMYVNAKTLVNERPPSVQEDDHAYEILHLKPSPPKRKSPADRNQEYGQGVTRKEFCYFLFVTGCLMFVLFGMVTGVIVILDVLHNSRDLHRSWEPWAPWSPCSVTCDFGISVRKRSCSNGDSKTGLTDCVGDASEYRLCNEALCNGLAVNGGWSKWLSWGTCSTTCDAGLQSRQRTCSNPRPNNGGEHCFGDSSEYKSCVLRTCPAVNGGWSEWLSWGTCSTTCNTGLHSRQRKCSNPRPSNGGEHCFGDTSEYRTCMLRTCPAVNGEWGAWSTWESCSTTCGTGLQSRQRNCSSNAGAYCLGESTHYRSCYLTYCSVSDGYWSSWSSWSNCSSTCTKTRTRSCTTYTGGRQCLGNSFDKENCNPAECALFAQYDCREAQKNGFGTSGVYEIFLQKSKQKIRVYCDMTTDGGGWTVFQNRFSGSVDFYRSISEYTNGFGTLEGEFWLGLKYIQELTDPTVGASELRLDLSAADNSTAYEVFQNFYLSGGDNYTLNIDNGTGTAGDSQGLSYNNRWGFSTYDRRLDRGSTNCPVKDRGGWWYDNCTYANLNGEYATPGTNSSGEGGMTYRDFKSVESLKTSKMMFRRAGQ